DSDEAEEEDSDNAESDNAPSLDWKQVAINVDNKATEVAANNKIEAVNMNFVSSGETLVPVAILEDIVGKNITLAFHNGAGVALSVNGKDINQERLAHSKNIDLTAECGTNHIPASVVVGKTALDAREVSIQSGNFAVFVNMHINVGSENAGKYANLYRYNAETKKLEYCSSYIVTRNGQAMFAITTGGNYLVTITNQLPKETLWFKGNSGAYIVKAGDSLSRIAQKYNMTLADILRKNPQITDPDMIRVGQKVNL
ncbi:MAG: LysM peptidoglycan-binding domain-containing protein, partial [Lachnospiraceae bacterium]|nr:LysM peptidoglycan-binding domain-containing protein [Lachnospiraceae bacterium]